jgi:hypothetical protein
MHCAAEKKWGEQEPPALGNTGGEADMAKLITNVGGGENADHRSRTVPG